jgi:hypothetical protein
LAADALSLIFGCGRVLEEPQVRELPRQLPPDKILGCSTAGEIHHDQVGDDGEPRARSIAVAGLYGDRLELGYGTRGGWDSFCPVRLVTRSENNVLHELDERPAVDIYKNYLGDQTRDLPASGLLPIGSRERPMRANFDRLVDGAAEAAEQGRLDEGSLVDTTSLALLVSCVGRKLILKCDASTTRSRPCAMFTAKGRSSPVSTPTAKSLPVARRPAAPCTTRR